MRDDDDGYTGHTLTEIVEQLITDEDRRVEAVARACNVDVDEAALLLDTWTLAEEDRQEYLRQNAARMEAEDRQLVVHLHDGLRGSGPFAGSIFTRGGCVLTNTSGSDDGSDDDGGDEP